jgi:endonuclease YncB( thermonuclease family)|tara:strand:- start:170 stop:544 length:375 start_codon:yes stop_codon:yes gene_type:complete
MKTRFYYGCELLRVIDGDTIDVRADLGFDVSLRLRLRFAGINTPESRTRNLEERALGKVATARLVEILESADSLEFESFGKGKFGRVLATPYAVIGDERTDVCQMLVREGHARLYDGGKREPWT